MRNRDGHYMTVEIFGYPGLTGRFHCPHQKPTKDMPFEDWPTCWQAYRVDEYDENENPIPDIDYINTEDLCLPLQWWENEQNELWCNQELFEVKSVPIPIEWWFVESSSLLIAPYEEKS